MPILPGVPRLHGLPTLGRDIGFDKPSARLLAHNPLKGRGHVLDRGRLRDRHDLREVLGQGLAGRRESDDGDAMAPQFANGVLAGAVQKLEIEHSGIGQIVGDPVHDLGTAREGTNDGVSGLGEPLGQIHRDHEFVLGNEDTHGQPPTMTVGRDLITIKAARAA